MKHPAKKLLAYLLALALALPLCACGETNSSSFREIDVLGVKQYCVICRKDDKLAPLLDAALASLAADGSLAAASRRWLGRDLISLKAGAATPAPEAEEDGDESADAETEAAPAPRTLIVGVEQGFEPMAFYESGVLRGMSVDIADGLGRVLGWDVAYQPISAGEAGTQLSSGNIDCALGFDPGTVRADKYTVGVCYMESDIVLAARRDGGARRWKDLQDEKIGTVDDPIVTALLQNSDQAARYAAAVTIYNSPVRCAFALDNGWCAAIALDRIMLDRLT